MDRAGEAGFIEVGASAPAIGKIKQMAGGIKHPQVGICQRAHMAG